MLNARLCTTPLVIWPERGHMRNTLAALPPIAENPDDLPLFGSPEFERMCDAAISKAAEKYAWIAQFEGVVLRRNPLGGSAYKDRVFNRISKHDFGFHYWRGGQRRRWYPDLETLFGEAVDNDGDDDRGIIVAEKVGFLPGQGEIAHDKDGCRILNMWQPPIWSVDLSAEVPTTFIEHVRYLVDDDETALAHLLNFFAHLVQRPEQRPAHALLITSEAKGIGKSTLGNVLGSLVGERNTRVAQTKDLKGQFDGWLMGKMLIQVDEVYEAGNWDLANKLKPLITERRVSVNIKYGPQTETDNFARFILFSNHPAPISIEQGDRRYFVVNSRAQPRNPSYYEALNAYISSHKGMTEIFTYLHQKDITAFNPFAPPPINQSKTEIIESSRNPLFTYIKETAQNGYLEDCFSSQTFTYDQIVRQLQKDGFGSHARNTRELSEALRLAGVEKSRETIGGTKLRVFRLPDSVRRETEPAAF